MHILLTGLNHKSASLEIRDQVSFSKEKIVEALPRMKKEIGEAVIISTCNRTEIYTSTPNPEKTSAEIVRFISDFHSVPADEIAGHFYHCEDREAVNHLFKVSSGLDSMILGESQILGQIRDALTLASEAQSAKAPMIGLFHGAIRAGRRVREETAVGRSALSISYAGVRLAERILGDLRSLKVVLVGAGEAGRLVAAALHTSGVTKITVVNRTLSRAEELALEFGGVASTFSELPNVITGADIVVAATDAPHYIIKQEMVRAAVAARPLEPQFYLDLAVPRDIDPEIASLDGVSLYDVDDLASITEENLADRKRAAVAAEIIVTEETERFLRWWESLDAVPIIKTLRQQADEIRNRELTRALRMMPDMSEEQVRVIEAMSHSIVKKLLHDPTISLKQRTDKTQLQAAKDLFRLWDTAPDSESPYS